MKQEAGSGGRMAGSTSLISLTFRLTTRTNINITNSNPDAQRNMESTSPSPSPSPEFSPLAIGVDLAPLPTYKAATITSIDFSGLLDPPLRLHEDLSKGCGGQLWPAGMVLGKHVLRYQEDSLRDARMLAFS